MNALAMIQAVQEEPIAIDQVHRMAAWFFWAGGTVISVTLGTALMLGLLLMTMVVAPGVTSRCTGALRERNIVSFLAGALMFGVFALLGVAGQKAPIVAFAAVSGFTVLGLVGLAAGAEDIGRRLAWICGKEGTRAHHLAAGWLVFAAAASVPIVGWFIVLPYVALSGLGSILVGTLRGNDPTPAGRAPVDMEIR